MNGFVGEFLVLLGSYHANRGYTILAATGVVLSAVYMLWMFQRVVFGEIKNDKNRVLPDLSSREKLILVPIVVLIFWMGVYSQSFLRKMDSTVTQVLNEMQSSAVVLRK
jgi:NADH-quinone oxidoreductase subunit M